MGIYGQHTQFMNRSNTLRQLVSEVLFVTRMGWLGVINYLDYLRFEVKWPPLSSMVSLGKFCHWGLLGSVSRGLITRKTDFRKGSPCWGGSCIILTWQNNLYSHGKFLIATLDGRRVYVEESLPIHPRRGCYTHGMFPCYLSATSGGWAVLTVHLNHDIHWGNDVEFHAANDPCSITGWLSRWGIHLLQVQQEPRWRSQILVPKNLCLAPLDSIDPLSDALTGKKRLGEKCVLRRFPWNGNVVDVTNLQAVSGCVWK